MGRKRHKRKQRASFQVEDLVRAYVNSGSRTFNFKRALRALILRDYDRYTDQTNDFIMNLFATNWYSLTQEQILAFSRNMGVAENREGIRRVFVDYIVREDQSKLTLPTSDVYDSLHLSGAILLVPPI